MQVTTAKAVALSVVLESADSSATQNTLTTTSSAQLASEVNAVDSLSPSFGPTFPDPPHSEVEATVRFQKPKKANYRQRAHCNPLADGLLARPLSPDFVDWSLCFPAHYYEFRADADSGKRPPANLSVPTLSLNVKDGVDSTSFEECSALYEDSHCSPHEGSSNSTDGVPKDMFHKADGSSKRKMNKEGVKGPDTAHELHRWDLAMQHFADNSKDSLYSLHRRDRVNGILSPRVEFLDVGCGFGGLLVALAPVFPDTLMLGVEIRQKVSMYAARRLIYLRQQNRKEQLYSNAAVLRTNIMKTLPNYFRQGQLKKMFFCFPDPQFKRRNWKRRIITSGLLSMYAYFLEQGGHIYTVTDVKDLHDWMKQKLDEHPLFEEVPEEEKNADCCVRAIENKTDEARKVIRMEGDRFSSLFRRRPNPPC